MNPSIECQKHIDMSNRLTMNTNRPTSEWYNFKTCNETKTKKLASRIEIEVEEMKKS